MRVRISFHYVMASLLKHAPSRGANQQRPLICMPSGTTRKLISIHKHYTCTHAHMRMHTSMLSYRLQKFDLMYGQAVAAPAGSLHGNDAVLHPQVPYFDALVLHTPRIYVSAAHACASLH